jgi:LPS-assembly protein
MKNNLFLIYFLICFFLNNNLNAKSFQLEAKNIDISDNGNLVKAIDGKGTSIDKDIEIYAKELLYQKKSGILKASKKGSILILSKNLKIEFDNAIIDELNSTIIATGNVKIYNSLNELLIESEKITYNNNLEYIRSNTDTVIKDKFKNIYNVKSFLFELNNKILKLENLKFIDFENNTLETSIAFLNTETNNLYGKDVILNLNNKSFEKNNQPRLKANSMVNNEVSTEITKGIFTTCKKRDGCPPWKISAEKIIHDKKKKTLNYENAFLSIYDTPIIYFPKFYHPDPTVKRTSGFLVPSIKNSSDDNKNYLNLPYFLVLAENRDMTLSPRIFSKEKLMLQTEFRQAGLKSNHISDFSFFKQKNINDGNHFFYNYDKKFNMGNFFDNLINFKIQSTSKDTYLKANKIKSKLISDNNVLENSLDVSLYSSDLTINIESVIYEDLNKKGNDRYDYILPKIDLIKNLNNNTGLKGDFSFKSQNLIRNYNTNVFEKININDLIFTSFPKIKNSGLVNNYEFIIKNSNTDTNNSKNYKQDENITLTGTYQFNSKMPLMKKNENHQKIFTPKISLKISPQHTKDDRNDDSRVDINNIDSLNRLADNDTVEDGFSLTYGSEYSVAQNDTLKEIFNFKIANNLRFKESDDLPGRNQMGSKTSNFFGEVEFNPYDFIKTKYSTSIRNNLSDINYENFITEFKTDKILLTFDYVNENDNFNEQSYLQNTSQYSFDNFNSMKFSTRKNKSTDLTEYYNLMYQYKNDCLAASIEYNKDYYSDQDLKPTESFLLKLTIIPFGETTGPNLKQ